MILIVGLVHRTTTSAAPTTQPDSASAQPIVAVFEVTGEITEQPADEMAAIFGEKQVSLRDLLGNIRKAADDPQVKAIVISADRGSVGLAQAEEIRQAVQRVRDAGKDVYAHADSIEMRQYVLLSGASRLSVVPTADAWVTGLYGEQPYLRGLLDKIGVKPQILQCGAYKSAGELFMRDGPSPEADAMYNWLFDSIYQTQVQLIARGRRVDESKVRGWIDNGPYTARSAKDAGLIDAVEHRQDFEAMIRNKFGETVRFEKKYGQPKKKQLDLSNPMAMFKVLGDLLGGGGQQQKPKSTKPAVGIVYVDGTIVTGRAESSPFGGTSGAHSSDLRKALDQAADDDAIKAVVLRIDSPGGSATASEIILDATRRVKAKKPLVVSMGNVAGSGGYYVACASDTIFADEDTITASIGVVGGKFVTTDMWKKVGINFKPYARGKNAGLLTSEAPFTPEQQQRIQGWMDEIYGVFKQHVTDIRGSKLKKPIDELAGGRVYTGRQALELGLVDRIGTLQDAIEFASSQAKLAPGGYHVRVVPEPKNLLEKMFSGGADKDDDPRRLTLAAPHQSLADLAMPYLKDLDPDRVRAIRTALDRLQLMNDEPGAVMLMPEVFATK
jgi:protease-4